MEALPHHRLRHGGRAQISLNNGAPLTLHFTQLCCKMLPNKPHVIILWKVTQTFPGLFNVLKKSRWASTMQVFVRFVLMIVLMMSWVKQKHLFHDEKPWVLCFVLLLVRAYLLSSPHYLLLAVSSSYSLRSSMVFKGTSQQLQLYSAQLNRNRLVPQSWNLFFLFFKWMSVQTWNLNHPAAL